MTIHILSPCTESTMHTNPKHVGFESSCHWDFHWLRDALCLKQSCHLGGDTSNVPMIELIIPYSMHSEYTFAFIFKKLQITGWLLGQVCNHGKPGCIKIPIKLANNSTWWKNLGGWKHGTSLSKFWSISSRAGWDDYLAVQDTDEQDNIWHRNKPFNRNKQNVNKQAFSILTFPESSLWTEQQDVDIIFGKLYMQTVNYEHVEKCLPITVFKQHVCNGFPVNPCRNRCSLVLVELD